MQVQPMQAQVITVQPGIAVTMKNEMWSSSLCDCCQDMGVCCFGFWCPCCLACQINSDFGECLCMPLLDIAFGGIPAASMALRSAMRERYHLQGSLCDDCCIVTCCTVCAWCQMAREIKRHRRTRLLDATPTTTVALNIHQPPQKPSYPPQPLYQAPMGHPPMS